MTVEIALMIIYEVTQTGLNLTLRNEFIDFFERVKHDVIFKDLLQFYKTYVSDYV